MRQNESNLSYLSHVEKELLNLNATSQKQEDQEITSAASARLFH